MNVTRRQTLRALATGAAVTALSGVRGLQASIPTGGLTAAATDAEGKVRHELLPYERLHAPTVASRAYDNYYAGECMYAVFASIVEELAERVGEPYTSFPKTFTRYGAGGVVGWATLCGALNGAAMAIYLVSPDPEPAIDEVFGFYGQAELPNYRPAQAKHAVATSVAESVLCHVSVSKWCEASGKKSFSPERSDRCAQLSASVAKKTVEVLNAQFDGSFKPAYALPAAVEDCRGCHDKGSRFENTRGKDSCPSCHTGFLENHP
jgi:hypothetical protein